MRIKQIYSRFGWTHKGELMKKYNLVTATDMNQPCLFFGIYGDSQIEKALKWSEKSKIVIWLSGSDASYLKTKQNYVDQFIVNPNVTFIATVNFIEKDLIEMWLPYKKVPLFSHRIDAFKPCPLGDSIYIYKPGSHIYCPPDILKRIKSEFKHIPIIEAPNHHTFTQEELKEVYRKSFLGIRLTKHDGLSHGVCEMGLMGRPMIHNGDTPNSIHYPNEDNILYEIANLIKYKFVVDPFKMAKEMYDYLNVSDDWLEV